MQIKTLSNERWLLKRRTAHSVIIWPLSWLQRPSRAPPLYNHFCALFWKPLTNLISHSADKLSLYFLHSDYPTPSLLPNPHKSKIMLLCAANFAIATNFATVALAISGHPTESAAEKATDALVDNTVATIRIRTKHFKSSQTKVVKREARCLNYENPCSHLIWRPAPTSPPGSLDITIRHGFLL